MIVSYPNLSKVLSQTMAASVELLCVAASVELPCVAASVEQPNYGSQC